MRVKTGHQVPASRNGAFHEEITQKEARSNSQAVSPSQFQDIASRGAARVDRLSAHSSGTKGLDNKWESIKDAAHAEVQKSWGGQTINARSGRAINPKGNRYSVTIRPPGMNSVSMPENVSRQQFGEQMDEARSRFGSQLNMRRGHLGLFHDDEEHKIDIDPVAVVRRKKTSDEIGAYTHAVGGAYHFKSGDGFFPPHVRDDLR